MEFYVFIAIFAYLLFAVNAVIDKFLLHDSRIGHPATYAFAIGVLSLIVIVLAPFGFSVPSAQLIGLALFAGALFTFALLTFFAALKRGEASRVIPIQGGLVPFFTLVMAFLLFGEKLGQTGVTAFVLLVVGSLFLSVEDIGQKSRMQKDMLTFAIGSAFLFALSFTLTKMVFLELGFVNGFIWTRFGMAIGAVFLLTDRGARAAIISGFSQPKKETGFLFLAGQTVGALAGISQNYAIALGSVTLVNALQSTQFLFLFALTIIFSIWYPKILKEKLTVEVLTRKVIGIILVSGGVLTLALY